MHPEWMLRTGNFGNTDSIENIQIVLKDDEITADPQSIELLDTTNDTLEYKRSDGIIVEKAYSDAEPHKFAEQLKAIVKYLNAKTALDYGSGGSDLNKTKLCNGEKFIDYIGLNKIHSFEPARSKRNKRKSDIVLCFDVLEHIFINDVPWVLNDIFSHAKKCVIINVACFEAGALLPTGENAHVTVKHPLWWLGQLECISTLHKDISWALYTCENYDEPKFHGIRKMDANITSNKFRHLDSF